MRIKITFQNRGKMVFPTDYNSIIQGFIYHNLDEVLTTFLHDTGYVLGHRSFKLFTFSRLLGNYDYHKDRGFIFIPPVSLYLSSPHIEILESFTRHLVKKKVNELGNNKVVVDRVEVEMSQNLNDKVIIQMLSPIVVYSTLTGPDDRKKTYYYNPHERDFNVYIVSNLIKKYSLIHKSLPHNSNLEIIPLNVKRSDEKIIHFKGTVIRGWMGRYQLQGNPELIKVGYDVGIGSKNSQGFDCFKIFHNCAGAIDE